MNRYSPSVPSRLFATSILLALSQQSLSKAESSVPKAAKSSIWQLGIGADPTQLLGETKTSPDVQELVQAWSPDFRRLAQ